MKPKKKLESIAPSGVPTAKMSRPSMNKGQSTRAAERLTSLGFGSKRK